MSKRRRKDAGGRPSARPFWLYLAGAFACLVVAGCIPAPGMDNSPYVLLPYAVAVVAAGLSASRMLGASLWRVKPEQLEEKEGARAQSVGQRLFVGLVACIACAVGALFHLLTNGFDVSFGYSGTAGGAMYSIGHILLVLAAALCFARARQECANA